LAALIGPKGKFGAQERKLFDPPRPASSPGSSLPGPSCPGPCHRGDTTVAGNPMESPFWAPRIARKGEPPEFTRGRLPGPHPGGFPPLPPGKGPGVPRGTFRIPPSKPPAGPRKASFPWGTKALIRGNLSPKGVRPPLVGPRNCGPEPGKFGPGWKIGDPPLSPRGPLPAPAGGRGARYLNALSPGPIARGSTRGRGR